MSDSYVADQIYLVRVSRPLTVGPFKYLPRDEIRCTGAHLNQIIAEHGSDVIASAVAL